MRVVLDTNILFVSVSEYSQYYPIYKSLINADFIVTEDRHFRVLKQIAFPAVRVVSIGDFLQLIQQLSPKQ